MQLIAYSLCDNPPAIVPASRSRRWMDETPQRHAYRCLPMLMANALGWNILCPVSFTATWQGDRGLNGVAIDFEGATWNSVSSHFGSGILTFNIDYLFRTEAGHNLWVRGPANEGKDGIGPLEGVVEADWLPFTFTMNWRFTRPGTIRFEQGEPFCTLLPYPRGYIESVQPVVRPLASDEALSAAYAGWRQARDEFNAGLRVTGSAAQQRKWQRDYFQGNNQQNERFEEHQTRLALHEFEHETESDTY